LLDEDEKEDVPKQELPICAKPAQPLPQAVAPEVVKGKEKAGEGGFLSNVLSYLLDPPVNRPTRSDSAPSISGHGKEPQAKFVGDVSLSDGCIVPGGSVQRKIWTVRNTGREPWPNGLTLVHVGGKLAPTLMPGEVVSVPSCRPGETVGISVPVAIPVEPGRWTGYYRLNTDRNKQFGPRIWVDVTVPIVEAIPLPPPGNDGHSQFPVQFEQLRQLGFTDCNTEKLNNLLAAADGNVERVANWLMNQ